MQYLGRKLTMSESSMIQEFVVEKRMNNMLRELYEKCIEKDLFVPYLTTLSGNCLFESLNYFGIGDSVKELRKSISYLMYILQDVKNIFPDQETSLRELFQMANEIEYVTCENENEPLTCYKYTYNIMCQDLRNNYSWTRLPTQLILMLISLIYKAEIKIINNATNYEHTINMNQNSEMIIYLGHLGESHYIPLDMGDEFTPIYYDTQKNKFLNWREKMQNLKVSEYLIRRQNETKRRRRRRKHRKKSFDQFMEEYLKDQKRL